MMDDDTTCDNGGSITNEADQTEADRETQETKPTIAKQTIAADPTAAMQSALTNFDGQRVDAAIQVAFKYSVFEDNVCVFAIKWPTVKQIAQNYAIYRNFGYPFYNTGN